MTTATIIPVPAPIVDHQEKTCAFCAGWHHSEGKLSEAEANDWRERFGRPQLSPGDDITSSNPIENAFWWGYYSQRATAQSRSRETEDVMREVEHNPDDLVTMHTRMARNPGFIPNWVWQRGSGDELDERPDDPARG